MKKEIVLVDSIESKIHIIRGKKVMIDSELATLYGATTKKFNQQIKRNLKRFPDDFMFKLTAKETANLRSQIVTSSLHGGRRYLPYVFTEHGALMAANIINSDFAAQVSVYVVRAFIKQREVLATHKDLAIKLGLLEQKIGKHDHDILAIIKTLQTLIEPPPETKPRRRIGFRRNHEK